MDLKKRNECKIAQSKAEAKLRKSIDGLHQDSISKATEDYDLAIKQDLVR
jgi:hypothetical protein